MSLETFEKVVEWLPKNCDVFFAGYGEPLLHKDLLLFINQLYKKGVGVSLLTNGKLLTTEKINQLFDAGLERLQISILLRDEINDIQKYVGMSKSTKAAKVRFNLMYDNTMEKSIALTEKLQKQGFEVSYKQIHNRGNELYNAVYQGEILSCGTFFIDSYIDTNGSLQVCSNDINGKYNHGSIYDMTFEDYIEKKKQYLGNKQIIPICEHCTDEYRLKHLKYE
jgi:hypothetical protein